MIRRDVDFYLANICKVWYKGKAVGAVLRNKAIAAAGESLSLKNHGYISAFELKS